MESLPVEMRSRIFSFLDAKSLLACSRINEGWAVETTNYLLPRIWIQACVDANIIVDSTKRESAEKLKAFFSSMMQRKDDMQASTCFTLVPRRVLEPLTAIYCSDKRIAMAFTTETIEIWNLPEYQFFRGFRCDFEPSFLKFDNIILLAGRAYGIIRSWSIESGRVLRDFSRFGELVMSFDFLTDCDIFVNCYIKDHVFMTGVHIYSISDVQVASNLFPRRQVLISRVMLAPHPDYPASEERKTCFLFCLAVDYVYVYTVVLRPHTISCELMASRRFADIPFHIQTANVRFYKPLGGLLFDGRNLYIRTTSLGSATHAIWKWDFRSGDRSCMQNDDQVISLLGVGQMYVAYERKTEGNLERILISHKVTQEVVATIEMPQRNTLANDYLCLVKTSWLNGLDGENDSGIISASIAEDRCVINFIQFSARRE